MSTQVQGSPVSQESRLYQALPRLGVVTIGGLYTIGVLIVNMDLARYGVVNLDLARPEYLLAGGLWSFVTLIMVATIQFGLASVKRNYSRRGWRKVLFLCLDAVGLIGTPFILLPIVRLEGLYEPPVWKNALIPSACLYLTALGPLLLVQRVGRLVRDESDAIKGLVTFLNRSDFFNVLSLTLLGLSMYSTQVFPFLPKYLGGGSKPMVQIVLSETPRLDWSVVGGRNGEDGKTVGPVVLLSETGTMFVIRRYEPFDGRSFFPDSRRSPAIGLDKKLVSAVIYVVRAGEGA